MDYNSKLKKKWSEGKSLCIGLDPVMDKLPNGIKSFFEFNKQIIDATYDIVCAYKPNSAFYEALGANGISELKKTIDYINNKYPEIVTILDAKRGDIDSTNEGYVKFAFDYLKSDAITIHPYLGKVANEPFLKRRDKGILVLCKTSNEGSSEFQNIHDLYLKVAENVANNWNTNGNCGVVVGATYSEELKKVREVTSDLPILIPGIGAQGGDLKKTIRAVKRNFIISASRSIIFASSGHDFASAAREEAIAIDKKIRAVLSE